MIANWIHVMIVHVAVFGTPWMIYRVISDRKAPLDDQRWKQNYTTLIILGLIAGIAYFTGPKAADWTKEVLVNYPQDHVENHALWGRVGFVIQVICALIGVMGWASIAQEEKPDKRIPLILMSFLLVNTVVMLYTAHLGGLIRRMDLLDSV
jgi:hypothetical protein